MIKRSSQTLRAWFVLSDVLMTAMAWLGAYYFRFHSGLIPIYKDVPDVNHCWRGLPGIVILALIAFYLAGQYEVHRLRRLREELTAVLKGVCLLSLFAMAMSFYRQDPYESRAAMILFSVFAFVSVLGARRMGWWGVHLIRRRGYNQSYALIVGTGRSARKLSRTLRRASWLGIRTIGHVEDRPTRFTSDLHILGHTDDLPALVARYQISHVFISLPLDRYDEARRVYSILSDSFVEVRMILDVPALAGLSLTTTHLDGMPVIGLRESPHFGLNVVVKRVMDFTFSLLGLIALMPFLVTIGILVKATSRGPMFYSQERCSLNGSRFQMLKFRSMKQNAEAGTGAQFASKNDSRCTQLGSFLRKTSLDELPQLINVLMGDMSLVGPRPERPEFIDKFRKTIPNYMARHSVKCGITGWAQVHGWRGNTSLRKRIQYDLYYITHWNPWLDLRILITTVLKLLFGRQPHAY